jgi:hypothetical protein
MQVQFDVLGSLVVNRIVGEVYRGDIVVEDDAGLVHRNAQLRKEVPEPVALCGRVGNSAILCFSGGTRHDWLAF